MKRQGKSVGKLVVLENGDRISAETEQIHNRIRERAYEISQTRGHAGREMEDWLLAESDIISVPPMHMIEKDGTFHVQMAVPGISPDDLNVMAASEQMLVKCTKAHEHPDDAEVLHVCDFKSGTLFRSFRFPQPIDLDTLNIEFKDGMLRISAVREGAAAAPRPAARKRSAARKASIIKGKSGAA
jgi:HSP20 family protein